VDFELTDEQRLTQDTVRTFVDEQVLPNAIENDIAHRLDMSVIEGMAELGLLGIVVPEEYGGAGLDFVAEALACEEIERGEAAFRTLISVHVGLNSLALLRYASEEQKQRWLVPQAGGEKIACFGLTEPAAGSDVASMKTTARRQGDVYVLNGSKNWISYATVADHALVFAKTDPKSAHKGISAFVLEKGMPGFTAADTEHKLGVWAGSTGELFFNNVEVPAENMIGQEGQGFEIAMYGLDQGRFTVAAGATGVTRACLERSVEYARERATFGQPIGKYQFVQDMIAEMVLGYETSKLLVMQAAWMKNEGRRNTRETSLAKWHATESAFRAAHLAIQVHGAYGYSAEYGIERYFRNARAPIIYEGTTQIHKLMQAEHALGYRPLNGRDGEVSPLCSWAPALAAVHREPPVLTGQLRAAAPRPVARIGTDPGADRVVEDIPARRREVFLGVDDVDGVAALEEVSTTLVAPVELLRIAAVQLAHPARETLARRVEDEVVVVRHETERVANPLVAGDDRSEQSQKSSPVDVVNEDRRAVIAARRDVVEAVGQLASGAAGHGSRLGTPGA
jgi:glutaryl-CoA dehydrogenase (non-decarboxylating)